MSQTLDELWNELNSRRTQRNKLVSVFSDDLIAHYRTHPLEFIDTELVWKHQPVMRSPQTDEFVVDMAEPVNTKAIVCAGRGGGKTFTCSEVALHNAVCYPDTEIVVVGGSMEQSRKLYSYVRHFVDNNPRLSNMLVGRARISETVFSNGSIIKALPCSERKVRAPHPNILFLDEVAAADKAGKTEVIEAALDSTSGATTKWFPQPRIVLTSTAHYAGGLYLRFWLNSTRYGYKRYKWASAEIDWENRKVIRSLVPWITVEQIQDALVSKPKAEFLVEWQGELKGSLSRVFAEDDIERSIRPVPKFPVHPKHLRCAGIDWASAKPTIVTVVEYYDGKWWILDAISIYTQSISTKAEEIRKIWREYRIEDFYGDAGDQSANSRLAEVDVPITPVPFTHQKDLMMGVLRKVFENDLLRIPTNPRSVPLQTLIMQLKIYHYDEKDHFAKGDDDYVDSLALALFPWMHELMPDAGAGGAMADLGDFLGDSVKF